MESIGYLYGLAAQDRDAAALLEANLPSVATATDGFGNTAFSDVIAPLTQDVKQIVTAASRHAVTLACGASIILATGTAAMALRRGDSGVDVTQLQRNLAAAGFYDGPITGFYGSLTESAVEEFQLAQGLVVDGVAGQNTLAAVQGPVVAPQSLGTGDNPNFLARGNQGAAVRDLQQALTTAGYYSGPVTGYYGTLTEAAVIRFQQANGLAVDGIAGPVTLAELAVEQPATDVAAFVPVAQPAVVAPVEPAVVPSPAAVPSPAIAGDVLYLGDRGQAVLSLQTQLADLGFYSKKRLTGYYGSSTESAVKRFQEANDLVVNGIAGPLTFEKLRERFDEGL